MHADRMHGMFGMSQQPVHTMTGTKAAARICVWLLRPGLFCECKMQACNISEGTGRSATLDYHVDVERIVSVCKAGWFERYERLGSLRQVEL